MTSADRSAPAPDHPTPGSTIDLATDRDPSPAGSVTATDAAGGLGLSPARVRQLARDGRLELVHARPLRLSTSSVRRHRDEREGTTPPRSAVPAPPESPAPPRRVRWDGRAREWVPVR